MLHALTASTLCCLYYASTLPRRPDNVFGQGTLGFYKSIIATFSTPDYTIGMADMIAAGGLTALAVCGGPLVPFAPGCVRAASCWCLDLCVSIASIKVAQRNAP